ncbi:hypothetical protein EHO61_13290 [Leptospira fluminis]|uniref:Uncharacterized protein n=1 Tax=Leptospira fluminis TaxID=2484979 RepID=A0A4R9GMS1_9LEPT|nr:hypothetical protein [Leptospira fluminis]TGK17369.1 hypothetical protein EHO61_13290 [Leptospira fluminis]
MELFAVIFLNVVLGVGLYIGITAQVTKRIRSHMIRRINEEVRTLVDEIQSETENHIELLNSKVQAYKILVQKTDSLEEKLKSILKKVEELPERIGEISDLPLEFGSQPRPAGETTPRKEEFSSLEEVGLEEVASEEHSFREEYLTLIREKQKEMKKSPEAPEEKRTDLASKAGRGVGHLYRQNMPEDIPGMETVGKRENRGTASSQKIEEPADSGTIGILKNFGKRIKDSLGWKDAQELLASPSPTRPPQPMYNPSSTFDISLGGDPFSQALPLNAEATGGGSLRSKSEYVPETGQIEKAFPVKPKIRDNKIPVEQDFGRLLERKIAGFEPQKSDRVKISPEAILKDLPVGTTKIEKVVFLLKKGYSHEDISEALDLATGEVDIIERFRLERNRRV